MFAIKRTTRMQRTALVVLVTFILASFTSLTVVLSHEDCIRLVTFTEGPTGPQGVAVLLAAPVYAQEEPCCPGGPPVLVQLLLVGHASAHHEPCEDGNETCDYGRNPEKLWLDNPDGHPFERPFCDGIVGPDVAKHPLDTPENEDLYCDEVPGCWAYGLGPEQHH